MIHVESHKDINSYDIKWDGDITDLLEETAVLLYTLHQKSGIGLKELLRKLKKLCLAAYEVTPQEGDESAYVKDERSKETIQSIGRRARRRLR